MCGPIVDDVAAGSVLKRFCMAEACMQKHSMRHANNTMSVTTITIQPSEEEEDEEDGAKGACGRDPIGSGKAGEGGG